jgi:ribosomal peptide maturation radical SAM protein 1
MPFASAARPTIQIGLLTAIAERSGFKTDAYHFNIDLAAEISPDIYEALCEHRGNMTGEWLFARAAFGADAPSDEAGYFSAFPGEEKWAESIGKDLNFLTGLRTQVLPRFIGDCLDAVDWKQYRVVGFSSTFQQNVACLALARRIKESCPAVIIVFGGANMEGEMGSEYARGFPFIDYVVSGEGDQVFPNLLHDIATTGSAAPAPGLMVRTPGGVATLGQSAPFTNLDSSPVPDYEAFFERAGRLGVFEHHRMRMMIPFESSRGCWWGQKHHCTFCGLNGSGMSFRSKSPERVLSELGELARRHRISSFEAVDNILDLKYIEKFFAQIEQSRTDYIFFYEVKSNLTRNQIQTLFRGGVRRIQPGIESMSSHVLELMRKGCTMLQNVRCLKWCAYYGIRVSWNLIWGFPGEAEEDYRRELDVLRHITHLEPPVGVGRIWLERFSPNYTDRESFPVVNVRPEASYRFVYPEHVDLDKAAYFFDYEMHNTAPVSVHSATEQYVSEWQRSWNSERRDALTYRRTGDGILIDYKWADRQGTYSFAGALALIYEFCVETMHTAAQVTDHLRQSSEHFDGEAEDVREALDAFCRGRLMLGEDGKYLALAIPSNPNW